MAEEKAELRFILLGKTGDGKSTTGNFILKTDGFEARQSFDSVTRNVSLHSAFLSLDKRMVTVVDTPGLFDNNRAMLHVALEIQSSLNLVMPGPHAFLLVIKFARWTNEVEQAMGYLKMMFGKKLFKYTILIFTDVQNEEDFTKELKKNTSMKELLDECDGRYITLNNREENAARKDETLKQLLQLADKISGNGKKPYHRDIHILRIVLEKYASKRGNEYMMWKDIQQILSDQMKEELRKKFIKTAGTAVVGGLIVGAAAACIPVGAATVGLICAKAATGFAFGSSVSGVVRGLSNRE